MSTRFIKLKILSSNHYVLEKTLANIIDIIEKNKFKYKLVRLPTKVKSWTIMKSVFAYKISKEQFKFCVHKRIINLYNIDSLCLDVFLSLSISNLVQISIK